jgi:hypothetical protein
VHIAVDANWGYLGAAKLVEKWPRIDLLGFFEPFIPVRRRGWEWVEWMDCAA